MYEFDGDAKIVNAAAKAKAKAKAVRPESKAKKWASRPRSASVEPATAQESGDCFLLKHI